MTPLFYYMYVQMTVSTGIAIYFFELSQWHKACFCVGDYILPTHHPPPTTPQIGES